MFENEGEAPSVEPVDGQELESESQSTDTNEEEKQTEATKTQSLIRKLKLKVDGQEIEEDYDLSNEEQLIRDIQLARAAKKRLAEAQEEKRKAYEIAKQFDQDPETLLRRLGPKGYELAEKILIEKMQDEAMTEEERAYLKMKTEFEALKKEKEERDLSEKQRVEQEQDFKVAQQMQATIIDALKKAGAPSSPKAVQRMAQIFKNNLAIGLDLDVNDLAMEYKKEFLSDTTSILKDMTTEQMLEYLGEAKMKEIREMDFRRLRSKQKIDAFKKTPSSLRAPSPAEKSEYISTDEWIKESRRKAKE